MQRAKTVELLTQSFLPIVHSPSTRDVVGGVEAVAGFSGEHALPRHVIDAFTVVWARLRLCGHPDRLIAEMLAPLADVLRVEFTKRAE